MYNLFLKRDKQEKINDLIRILRINKAWDNNLSKSMRDYYNPLNTYRGTVEQFKNNQTSPEPVIVPKISIQDDGNIKLLKLVEGDGPMDGMSPAGHGLQLNIGKTYFATLTYSKVNIKDTKYSWMRIERNRAWQGYLSKKEIKYKNFGKKYKDEDAGNDIIEKPGLFQLYRRALKLNDDMGAKHYKKLLIDSMDDEYGRIYWYFIVKNNDTNLPNKFHERDYDNVNEEIPLYEKDFLYDKLDRTLKAHLNQVVQMSLGKKEKVPKVPNHKFNIHDVIAMQKNNTDDELTNIARTVAITRAKPYEVEIGRQTRFEKFGGGQYRLHEEYYSKKAGINIPARYFNTLSQGSQVIAFMANESSEKLKMQNKTKRDELLEKTKNVGNDEWSKDMLKSSIQREYWPVTTFEDYRKSFKRFKSTALVFVHSVNCILKELKPMLFNDKERIFMGEYHLEKKQYDTIKKWYNFCCDNLRRETVDLLSNMQPDRSSNLATGLLNPGKAHMFTPAGPRLRGRFRTPPRRNDEVESDAEYEDEGFDALMREVEADEALDEAGQVNHQFADEVDRIIANHARGQTYEWDRLMQVLRIPMDALRQAIAQFPLADNIQQALVFIQPYDIWRLQSREAHGENNIPQWHLLREICRRWDAGMPTPGPDIRTEAVRIAFPRGWPNNQLLPAPPMRGPTNQQVPLPDQDSGFSMKTWAQGFCLQIMPAILAILHKACFWTILNPIQEVDGITTIIPGCDWFKHMVFTLVTVEGYIPKLRVSASVRDWLVPQEFWNYPLTSNPSGPFVFQAAGMNEMGYVQNGEFYNNIIQERMKAQYVMWASQTNSRLNNQNALLNIAKKWNSTTTTMNEVVAAFQSKSAIEDLHSFLGENVNQYTQVDRIPRNMLVQNLQEAVSTRWAQAQVTCMRTEMDMYLQMDNLCYWWLGCSILFLLLSESKIMNFKNVDALSLLKMGITSGVGYYNYAYKFINLQSSDEKADIPRIVLGLQKTLFMASFVFTGQVYAALIDDRVDERNEHLVRRLTNRRAWFSWVTKIANYIQPFRIRHTRFIQLSRLFNRDQRTERFLEPVLVSNKPNMAPPGRYQCAWDIDRLNVPIRDDTLDSRTCTSNIHYPPGTIFTYQNEEYMVVDDLHSMYKPRTITDGEYSGLTAVQSIIRENFPGFNFTPQDNEAYREGVKETLFELVQKFSQQYRIAVRLSNLEDDQPQTIILSVAAKNYAQSIKNTVLFATANALYMEYNNLDGASDADYIGTVLASIGLMSSVENEKMFVPTLVGIGANAAVVSTSSGGGAPTKFAGMLAGVGMATATYKFFIPRAQQAWDDERLEHYLRLGWGLLIPLELRRYDVSGRIVFGGKLWCPLTGRIHIFKCNPRRANEQALAVFNPYIEADVMNYRPKVRLHRAFGFQAGRAGVRADIEDGFELEQRDEQLHMIFHYNKPDVQGRNQRYIDSRYVYSPMYCSKNLWFIRIPT